MAVNWSVPKVIQGLIVSLCCSSRVSYVAFYLGMSQYSSAVFLQQVFHWQGPLMYSVVCKAWSKSCKYFNSRAEPLTPTHVTDTFFYLELFRSLYINKTYLGIHNIKYLVPGYTWQSKRMSKRSVYSAKLPKLEKWKGREGETERREQQHCSPSSDLI